MNRQKRTSHLCACLCISLLMGGCVAPLADTDFQDGIKENAAMLLTTPVLYAGPGEEYHSYGEQKLDENVRVVRVQGQWAEIEDPTQGVHGFIPVSALDELEFEVPDIKKPVPSQHVPPLAQANTPDTIETGEQGTDKPEKPVTPNTPEPAPVEPEKTTGEKLKAVQDTSFYESEDAKKELFTIKAKSEVVLITPVVTDKDGEMVQVDAKNKDKKYRGYVYASELIGSNTPGSGIKDASEQNAKVTFKKVGYISTTGLPGKTGSDWKEDHHKELNEPKTDVKATIKSSLTGIPENAILNKFDGMDRILLQQAITDTPVNLYMDGKEEKQFATAINYLLGAPISLSNGKKKGLVLDLHGLSRRDANKLVIQSGDPIEAKYAGRTITLAELIKASPEHKGISDKEARKKENTILHEMYPDLPRKANLTIEMTFAKETKDNPYGYQLFLDKKLNLYALPIIHEGTSFIVYADGEPAVDAACDLARCVVQFDDKSAKSVVDVLEKNGYALREKKSSTDTGQTKPDKPASSEQSEKPASSEESSIDIPSTEVPDYTEEPSQDDNPSSVDPTDPLDAYEQKGGLEAIAGEWVADYETMNNVNPVSGFEFFGTGTKYGDKLSVGADGSFSYYVALGHGATGTISGSSHTFNYEGTRTENGEPESGELEFILSDGEECLRQMLDAQLPYYVYWKRAK